MLPLIVTDRHGESRALFHADHPSPLGYNPAGIDRSFNWATRFVMPLHRAERHRLETFAKLGAPHAPDLLIEQLERRRLLVCREDTGKDDKLAIEVPRNVIRTVLDKLLAPLTAGTGVAVILGNKAKLLHRLGELPRDLVKPLERLKARWGYGRPGKPRSQTPYSAPAEEVDVPGYQAPPKREGQDIDADPPTR